MSRYPSNAMTCRQDAKQMRKHKLCDSNYINSRRAYRVRPYTRPCAPNSIGPLASKVRQGLPVRFALPRADHQQQAANAYATWRRFRGVGLCYAGSHIRSVCLSGVHWVLLPERNCMQNLWDEMWGRDNYSSKISVMVVINQPYTNICLDFE